MPSDLASYIDICALDEVRGRFAAGEAVAILTTPLDQVIWANGPGAALFGCQDVAAIIGAEPRIGLPARRQIMATSGYPRIGKDRAITVRLASGLTSRAVSVSASEIALPDARDAILLAAAPATPSWRNPVDAGTRAIAGLGEPGRHAAILDAEGTPVARSAGFDRIGIATDVLRALVGEAAGERLTTRPVQAEAGALPANLVRLTDSPAVFLLFVSDETLPQAASVEGQALFAADQTSAEEQPSGPILSEDNGHAQQEDKIPAVEVLAVDSPEVSATESAQSDEPAAAEIAEPAAELAADVEQAPAAAATDEPAAAVATTAADVQAGQQAAEASPGELLPVETAEYGASAEASNEPAQPLSDDSVPIAAEDPHAQPDGVQEHISAEVGDLTAAAAAPSDAPSSDAETVSISVAHDTSVETGETERPAVSNQQPLAADGEAIATVTAEGPDVVAETAERGEVAVTAAFGDGTEAASRVDQTGETFSAEVRGDFVPAEASEEVQSSAGADDSATADGSTAADALAPTLEFDRSAAPVRFVWKTDAAGNFSEISPDFVSTVGAAAANLLGMGFREAAQKLGIDPSGEIAGLLERHDTWSGRSVLWPVAGTDLRIPVDLAALPTYDRERKFAGFRGFGIARAADAVVDPDATGFALLNSDDDTEPAPVEITAADEAAPAAAGPSGKDPFKGEPPVLTIVPKQERRSSDKVIRLAEHRQPTIDKALSPGERSAFREIGDRLKKDQGLPAAGSEPALRADNDLQRPADRSDGSPAARSGQDEEAEEPRPADTTDGGTGEQAGQEAAVEVAEAAPDGAVAWSEPASETLGDKSEEVGAEAAPMVAADAVPAQAANIAAEAVDTAEIDDVPTEAAGAIETDVADGAAEATEAGSELSDEPVEEQAEANAEPVADADPVYAAAEADPPSEAASAARAAIPQHYLPSAFATAVASRERIPIDTSILEKLPVPVLIHAGDRLHYANPEFLDFTGYDTVEELEAAGGLGVLFGEPYPADDDPEEPGRKLRLHTSEGLEYPVEAFLQSVPWGEGKALLLSLRRSWRQAVSYPAASLATSATASLATSATASPATSATASPATSGAGPLAATASPLAPTAASAEDVREIEARIEEMRAIVDTATDGVVLIAPDGTIRSISSPAEALFGFDSVGVAGRAFTSLFAIESQRAARDYLNGLSDHGVASVLNDGREVIGRESQGRFIPLFMTIGKLPNDSGYCAVVRDITQWKRAEEELTQARAQAERASSQKTDFLARVSHEIRTPLNAIIGFSELMLDEKFGPVGSDRYRDYLRDINRSGNHVLDLVNDLLDISKIEAGQQEMSYEAVSLNDTLSETVAMMQPAANRERVIIRSSFASRLPEVVADLRSIRQIALNLLSNAIRYTSAGGQVIVSTAYEPSGDVVMRVRDTGIGMSQAEIEQALKPFKQINALKRARGDGTGLGLPLTKAMVEANRARFIINSTPGEGTLVEVSFPSTRVLAD